MEAFAVPERKLDCAVSITTSYRMKGEATELTVHMQNSCRYEEPGSEMVSIHEAQAGSSGQRDAGRDAGSMTALRQPSSPHLSASATQTSRLPRKTTMQDASHSPSFFAM